MLVRRFALWLVASLAGLALAPAAQAQRYTCGTAGDDFNRANSSNLGPSWLERSGDWWIANNRAVQYDDDDGVITFVGADSANASVCVDVLKENSTKFQAAGIVLGYRTLNDSNFIRIQNNSADPATAARFDTAYFHPGVNGEPGPGGVVRFDTPFLGARLHATQVGSVVTLNIDVNQDGIADETFSYDYARYGAYAGSGSGAGLYNYDDVLMDNFRWAPIVLATPPGTGTGGGSTGGGPDAGSGSAAPDRTKPALGGLSFSASAFRSAKSGAAFSSQKGRRRSSAPIGTKVSFNLSEGGAIRFAVQRKTSGRRVSGKCRSRTRKNRARPKCTLWKGVRGSFTVPGRAGKNTFTYRGRMGGKSLGRGQYRLSGQATDTAGNRSAIKRKAFRIVR